MLLIDCPYCRMQRPEIEFRYAGEAHIARPSDPAALTDAEWADYLYMRTNPKGLHVERWRRDVMETTVSARMLLELLALKLPYRVDMVNAS